MPTMLRLVVVLSLVTPCLVVGASCRTNKIRQYIDDIEVVYVTTERPGSPRVSLGNSTQQDDLSAAVSNFGTALIAGEVQRKVNRAVSPRDVHRRFVDTFMDELDRGFNFELAKDADQACDAWIDIEVTDYGIWSATAESSVEYFLSATAYMRDCAEERLIWEKGITHQQPITAQYIGYNEADMVKGLGHTINLATLNGLSKRQLENMFELLAEEAAADIVGTMVTDAFGSQSRRSSRSRASDYDDEEELEDREEEEQEDDRRRRRR